MTMKECLYRFRPFNMYIIFILTLLYVLVQFVMSHITHSLTLLVHTYHILCNIIALTGCIITIKHIPLINPKVHPDKKEIFDAINIAKITGTEVNISQSSLPSIQSEKSLSTISEKSKNCHHHHHNHDHQHNDHEKCPTNIQKTPTSSDKSAHEATLRNTFGWIRIEVLTMLIVCILMASLCFSLVVEALKTLVHINQQDTMHHPQMVLVLAIIGVVLNGLCYLLIGGYTVRHGRFSHISSATAKCGGGVGDVDQITINKNNDGDIVLERIVTESYQLSSAAMEKVTSSPVTLETAVRPLVKDQRLRKCLDICRDLCSTVILIICCIAVEYSSNDENVSKYIDPIISIVSCVVLMTLSYPYMKESGMILLQTMPGTIDIEVFKTDLLKQFNDIVSVHDIHIWQLTADKIVSTAHIIFQDAHVYAKTKSDIVNFFRNNGITIVTIQPEFTIATSGIDATADASVAPPAVDTHNGNQQKSQLLNNLYSVSNTSLKTNASLAATNKPLMKSNSQCLVECQSTDCIDKICCNPNINEPFAALSLVTIIDSTLQVTTSYNSPTTATTSTTTITKTKSTKQSNQTKSMLNLKISASMLSMTGSDNAVSNRVHDSTSPSGIKEKCISNPNIINDSFENTCTTSTTKGTSSVSTSPTATAIISQVQSQSTDSIIKKD